jgi:hypothetical protein
VADLYILDVHVPWWAIAAIALVVIVTVWLWRNFREKP